MKRFWPATAVEVLGIVAVVAVCLAAGLLLLGCAPDLHPDHF